MSVSDSSPSMPAKQSASDSIPPCNVHFATSLENFCGCGDCGAGAGAGSGGSLMFLRYI